MSIRVSKVTGEEVYYSLTLLFCCPMTRLIVDAKLSLKDYERPCQLWMRQSDWMH